MEEIRGQWTTFKNQWDHKSSDLSNLEKQLTEMKKNMIHHGFLLPGNTQTDPRASLLAREILEHSVLLTVRKQDIDSFEKAFAQLKTYYTSDSKLPISQRQNTILGLNLLRLLALHRIAEFHTELELIQSQEENVFIKYPIQLEQYIMEGSYNKVFEAAQDVPAESYGYFIEYLIQKRLKDAIAESCEKAYESLTFEDAKKLLHCPSDGELIEYSQKREWKVKDNRIYFGQEDEVKKEEIPSTKLIIQTLAYAKELERIV